MLRQEFSPTTAGRGTNNLMATVEVIVAGDGKVAREWLDMLAGAQSARVVGYVGSLRSIPQQVARFEALSAARQFHPAARFAVAVPERAAAVVIDELQSIDAESLVQPPFLDNGSRAPTWTALDWTTLAGPGKARRLQESSSARAVRFDVRGVPTAEPGAEGDLSLTLVQALALAEAVVGPWQVHRALAKTDTHIALRGEAGAASVELSVRCAPEPLATIELIGDTVLTWRHQGGAEHLSIRRGDGARDRSWRSPPATARALTLLGTDSNRPLWEATRSSMHQVTELLGHELPPAPSAFAAVSAQLSAGAPVSPKLFGLPLVVDAADAAPPPLELPTTETPMEIHAFRADLKPVVFLTVSPDQADHTAAMAPGAHITRRHRRVLADAQDSWDDRRDRGEPMVELYIGHEREAVDRAVHLQSELDPSRAIVELGKLMGYPECCVQAFAAQTDRSNNTANRYHTLARTRSRGPLPWALNNLAVTVCPFFPCSYTCNHAIDFAERLLGEVKRTEPHHYRDFADRLSGKYVYLMHDQWFRRAPDGNWFRSPRLDPAMMRLAAALSASNDVRLDDEALVLWTAASATRRLARTDPGLGAVLDFG